MNLPLELQNEIKIISGGEYLCTPLWNNDISTSGNFFKLYMPIEGKAYLYNNASEFTLKPHHIYIIPPFFSIGSRCPDKMLIHWLHVKIEDRLFNHVFSKSKNILILKSENVTFGNSISQACELLGQNPDNPEFDQLRNKAKISMELHSAILTVLSKIMPENNIALDGKIEHIFNALESNLNKVLNLNEIAKSLSWSTPHLRKYFRERVGQTPGVYHENLRISKAQNLIKNSPQRISEISRECGWDDPLYFSKVFKNKVGVSPREYRNKGFEL